MVPRGRQWTAGAQTVGTQGTEYVYDAEGQIQVARFSRCPRGEDPLVVSYLADYRPLRARAVWETAKIGMITDDESETGRGTR